MERAAAVQSVTTPRLQRFQVDLAAVSRAPEHALAAYANTIESGDAQS
jgi:hypothetical protein